MHFLEHLLAEKQQGTHSRLGFLFDTEKHHYLFDAGTNKVALIDEPLGYDFLRMYFDHSTSTDSILSFVENHKGTDVLSLFLQQLESEHMLQATKMQSMQLLAPGKTYEDQVMHNLQQLTLEVTGRCNFRCKYCIYSEEYDGNRDFNSEDMTWDTARKAIDLALAHSGDCVSITFYGGEPLLNYDLIKQSIDYSLLNRGDKEISYSFTSNLSLMTEEMAEYFASVPNLGVVASIDGPQEMHDAFRVYANNRPTFKDTLRGLERIAKAFKKTGNELMVNAVYTPPYSFEKSRKMDEFFRSLPYLEGAQIRVTYPSPGTLHNIEKLYEDGEDKIDSMFDHGNPLSKWAWETFLSGTKSSMAEQYVLDRLQIAHFRVLLEHPTNRHHFNGCCVPGVRRLYVKTNGELALCERIGNSPSIGNVDDGVDIARVKQFYIDEYEKASLPDCANCWASNLCDLCYAHCYNDRGIDIAEKRTVCAYNRERIVTSLCMYHYLLEEHPERLEILKDIVMT